MPARFVVNGDMVTILFEWPNVPIDRAQEIVGNAALYDHRRGLGPTVGDEQKPWDDLSNQGKLDMVFQAAQRLIVAQAKAALVDTDVDAARQAAIDYADGAYNLD